MTRLLTITTIGLLALASCSAGNPDKACVDAVRKANTVIAVQESRIQTLEEGFYAARIDDQPTVDSARVRADQLAREAREAMPAYVDTVTSCTL